MRIESYSFGRIVIDGISYTSDVILSEGRINSSWWRRKGHLLTPEDLEEALDAEPELLVIGTGYSGVMKVPEETREFLRLRGIDYVIQRTEDACRTYNREVQKRRVVATLHLTC
ncbi:MAG: Mth938-like domain-containing protein [Thermoplasmata archaeon]